jgi:hypothetical protein
MTRGVEGQLSLDHYSSLAAKQMVKIDQIAIARLFRLSSGSYQFISVRFRENFLTSTIQVGTILIGEESPRMAQVLALQLLPYFKNWSVAKSLDDHTLDETIRLAHWNFFFLAQEIKAKFFGEATEGKVREALLQIAKKVRNQHFNCLEVTGILQKRFFGVPYTQVSTHPRHIQQSCSLDSVESRCNDQRDGDWARG